MTISNLFSLSGKVALVTGASRGIGKAIALGFAGAGAKLALVARSENKLLEVQAEIKALGSEAKIFPCNLRQIERILASDAAKYVHGHILTVDGGWMAR